MQSVPSRCEEHVSRCTQPWAHRMSCWFVALNSTSEPSMRSAASKTAGCALATARPSSLHPCTAHEGLCEEVSSKRKFHTTELGARGRGAQRTRAPAISFPAERNNRRPTGQCRWSVIQLSVAAVSQLKSRHNCPPSQEHREYVEHARQGASPCPNSSHTKP